ncbi:putative Quinate repressor protein [Glarea lozoyensis 74030]|uniref:Putative Quinate repressor protein n=1 Tax=Glarea lozoyensis (strain ATCC 74030 / MF5533) TaxID=1104152 RepID=H0EJF7_GLAL7|nr:putative Quinate repressor protein [Glarea lozoyensis 74030]
MPLQWLQSPSGGVVVEQIRMVREETQQAWVIVDGLEVLPEQAIAQFELMTGRKAPKRRMRMEVLENYHRYE